MRRIAAVALAALLTFSLAACNDSEAGVPRITEESALAR